MKYLKRLSLLRDLSQYSGAICGYLDFLFPLLSRLKKLPFFPNSPLFLLIDDSHHLNDTQKKVLNTWVSYRTSAEVSLKISTQVESYTFRTIAGFTIDSPHDYSEVNIVEFYTSNIDRYMECLKKITEKRLKKAKIYVMADDFFPVNEKQQKRIRKIHDCINDEHNLKSGENNPTDDAYRFASSEYMKELFAGGYRYPYCYAGFKELVHISSGTIRFFLESAAIMYSEMFAKITSKDKFIDHIDPMIQNQVIRKYSSEFMLDLNYKIKRDEKFQDIGNQKGVLSKTDKLKNLISGMGGLFHKILMSDLSERGTFSIALSDTPDEELEEILDLGVQFGYLYESTVSNKAKAGRCKLYILSRRLAPYFTLFPDSVVSYKKKGTPIRRFLSRV